MRIANTLTLIMSALTFVVLGCSNPYERDNPTDPIFVYKVTFNASDATGGTPPAALSGSWGDVVTLPDGGGLVRSGYVFGGWTDPADSKNYPIGSTYTITGNAAINVMWRPLITITFNGNGATSGSTWQPITVASDSVVQIPYTASYSLKKTGYVFDGWYSNSSGTGNKYLNGSSYGFSSDITLYAKWIPSYTVTLDGNGAMIDGRNSTTSSWNIAVGSSTVLPSWTSSDTKSGHVFGGWNTDISGTGTNYAAGFSYTPTGDVTLYANWLPLYTVTFDGNGATGGTAPVAITVTGGSSIKFPAKDDLEKTGYSFAGWNTDISGTGTSYAEGSSYTVTGNVTLYANWLPLYTVTFNANEATSGTAPVAITVTGGSSIELPAKGNLEKTGYGFGDWNTDISGTGTSYAVGSSYTVAGDITLYAVWTPCYTDTHYCSNGTMKEYGSMTDNNGQTYKTIVIGTQTWMAENLNYNPGTGYSACYSGQASNCEKYGRLYEWYDAQTVCPSGWHLPSEREWDVMTAYIGGASTAGKKLKATTGWDNNGNGTDDYGFSALPGGHFYTANSPFPAGYEDVGSRGGWWSTATGSMNNLAKYRSMRYNSDNAGWSEEYKAHYYSVRCLKNN